MCVCVCVCVNNTPETNENYEAKEGVLVAKHLSEELVGEATN